MKLTKSMRATLEKTERPEGIRRIHTPGPGRPPWPAHPATLAALLRHDLVDHTVDRDRHGHIREIWKINPAGLIMLHPPPRLVRDTPNLLNCRATITRIPQGGVWTDTRMPEPEKMTPGSEWKRRAERRHLRDQTNAHKNQRLHRTLRAA